MHPDIQTTVLNRCGDEGKQLLSPTTLQTYDAAGDITNLLVKCKYKVYPPVLVANATNAAKKSYHGGERG